MPDFAVFTSLSEIGHPSVYTSPVIEKSPSMIFAEFKAIGVPFLIVLYDKITVTNISYKERISEIPLYCNRRSSESRHVMNTAIRGCH